MQRWIGARGIAGLGEALALLLLAPMIASFTPRAPMWDEQFFFQHAACMRNALQALSFGIANQCLIGMMKSPIMAVTLLPSVPMHGPDSLTAAPITLGLMTFALLWLSVRLAQRGGLKLPLVIAAAAIASLAPPLTTDAPFLVDSLSTIVSLGTLLLLPAELSGVPLTARSAFRRGLLWGLLFGLGLLSKLTYLYFAGVVFSLLVLISLYREGIAATGWKVAGMAVAAVLPALLFLNYLGIYWQHATSLSFGPLTAFFNDHIPRWVYIRNSIVEMGWTYWLGIGLLLCYALYVGLRTRRIRGLLVGGALAAIVCGYLLIASGSPNKDPRFFWIVWLALPFCAATAGSGLSPEAARMPPLGLAPLWLSLVLTIATAGRFDLRPISRMDTILDSLPHQHPVRIMIASDEATFSIETLLLTRQLDMARFGSIDVGTVIYDIVSGLTPAQSIQRLAAADYVMFVSPLDGTAPPWTNQYLPQFEAAVKATGHLYRVFPGPGQQNTYVYATH